MYNAVDTIHRGVVKWYHTGLQNPYRGFDSHRPCHKTTSIPWWFCDRIKQRKPLLKPLASRQLLMETTSVQSPEVPTELSRSTRIKLFWSLGLSIFWVLFLWNFWQKGVYALGINVSVYLGLLAGLFLFELRRHDVVIKEHLFWILPMFMMIVSFALYDNPFLKGFSLLFLPPLFVLFYHYSFLKERAQVYWDASLLFKLFERCLDLFGQFGQALKSHIRFISFRTAHDAIIKRVLVGILLLLLISTILIVPILSSADAAFAASVHKIVDWIQTFISATVLGKSIATVVLSVITLAALLAWAKTFSVETCTQERKPLDPVVSGIVLTGILVLYLLFLGLQVQHLWMGTLPFDFKEVEQTVKSGFWQLLFLSVVNIGFYFFIYKKTLPAIQHLLTAFTIASLLLLASAAHRMTLYVISYGLSYEKFFASYTVLFCAILFVWLISRLFVAKRADILKFLVVLFLWMYALVTLLPVEQLILNTNIKLAERPETRINLSELTMLSPDVLSLVKHHQRSGVIQIIPDWIDWISVQEQHLAQKKWYEKNLTNILYQTERQEISP